MRGWIAGLYPLLPREATRGHEATRVLASCRDLPGFRGFEIPFTGSLDATDEGWLLDQLRPGDVVVVTLIPGVMARIENDSRYGLASSDPSGRRRALRDLELARDAIDRVVARVGTAHVLGIELHSAPQGGARGGRLEESLREIVSWDWGSTRLLIEHCDAATGPRPVKGFLSLEDEVQVARSFPEGTVGVVVNWGRSAIEGHDPSLPVAHLEVAAAAGVLDGLMFSGVSESPHARGGSWADTHLAPAAALEEPGPSLLTSDRIRAALEAAEPARFVGMKIAGTPTAGVDERVRVARASARALFVDA